MHRSALGAGALSDDWAQERLPRHSARDDFMFLVAREEGRVAGLRLRLHRRLRPVVDGQHRAVALARPSAPRGSIRRTSKWSSSTCVRRASGSGVGSRLLAQLLTRQPHDRAVLSTQTGSRKAREFYAKNGWAELADVDFGPGYPPYLVLGKLLA